MKYKFLILISIALAGQHLKAAIKEAPDIIPQEPQTYNKDTKIGFELINESPGPIWIAVQNGESFFEQNGNNTVKISSPQNATKEELRFTKAGLILPPIGTVKRLELDTNQDTILMLWNKDPGIVKIKDIFHPGHISLKKPSAMLTFTKGKTIYVRFTQLPELTKNPDPLLRIILPLTTKFAGTVQPQRIQRGDGPARTLTKLVVTNNVTETDIKGLPIP